MKLENVGLGTFPLAGVFAEVSKKEAEKIVRLFLERGGYFIDTAPMYGYGEVESLLGRILKNVPREDYYIATKCGFIGIDEKKLVVSSKYGDVIRGCDKSLRRLKVDYIDLYYIHTPDPETPFEETMGALAELQEEEKIKKIGVSNVSLAELKEYNKDGVVEFVQNRFSLINRSVDDRFEKYLLDNRISFNPYQVIERGQLSTQILRGIEFRKGDLRNTKPDWKPRKLKEIVEWVREELYPIAQKAGIEVEQLALAWTIHRRYVSPTLFGAENTQQLLTNLKASKIKLASNILKDIDNAYNNLRARIKEKYGVEVHEFRGLNEKFY